MIYPNTKTQPTIETKEPPGAAANRISSAFMKLLEGQFPIENVRTTLKLRTASDFAQQLNIHVNHLNRAVKAVQDNPTSVVINTRILSESQRLLRYSDWNVSEIAYALGFTEVTHFNNFFKRKTNMSPTQFRKSSIKPKNLE